MAKVIEEFNFGAPRTRQSKYPWEEWLDGQIRQLTKDEDFPTVKSASNFIQSAKTAAANKGKALRAYQVDPETVVIQAHDDPSLRPDAITSDAADGASTSTEPA